MNLLACLDILYAICVLILVVMGLAVVFGMLGIINMAHGEMLMLGGYSVYICTTAHLPFFVGVLLALLVTGLVGGVVYVCVVRRIENRLLDTILATWGVSLILKHGITLLFGAAGQHIEAPIVGSLWLGSIEYPIYRLTLMFMSVAVMGFTYVLFFKTRFGVKARAVMSNPTLAACSGINRNRINAMSFIMGAMLAGLAGAMLCPLLSLSPLVGEHYLVPSFLSVLVGGLGSITAPILGASVIAGIESSLSQFTDSVIAQIMMLCAAIFLLKRFPNGLLARRSK